MSVADERVQTEAGRAPRPLIQMSGIGKEFLGVRVLDDVDLDCMAGEIHAIVGENGAGKSTLMKIVCGAYRPSEGEIRIDGEAVEFHHPIEGQQAGVAIIYQEFNLLPDRTVAENIFLGREPRRGILIDRHGMEERSAELLAELAPDDPMSPRDLVGNLPVARQQTVEIAKALSLDSRIMVMDEPTAALAAHEVEQLFAQVRRLKERGIAVFYISHRLKEVFEIADRITVLKDGKLVKTVASNEVTSPELVRLMVGRELDQYFPPRAAPDSRGPVRLRLRGAGNDILVGHRPGRPRWGDCRRCGPPGIRPDRACAGDLRRRPAALRHARARRQGAPDRLAPRRGRSRNRIRHRGPQGRGSGPLPVDPRQRQPGLAGPETLPAPRARARGWDPGQGG